MLGFFVSDHQGAARQSMFDENVVETNKDEDKGVGEEGGGRRRRRRRKRGRQLSLLVNQSQMRIRQTRNRRNTDPNHGSIQ